METTPTLKRTYKSQHRQPKQIQPFQSSSKFKPLLKDLRTLKYRFNVVESSHNHTNNENESGKQYNKLQKKLMMNNTIKIVSRNFNKVFYTKLSKKIIQKPQSFYKFGLKQNERSSCKTVFAQLFKIKKQNLNGTISVNDLWDNRIMMKYLKENEAYVNKEILMRQFKSFDKEQKKKKKQQQNEKQKEFLTKYRQWIQENEKLNLANSHYQQLKQMNINDACTFIRSQIQRLNSVHKNYKIRTKSRAMIDGLQQNYQKFDQIAGKFKDKMILML